MTILDVNGTRVEVDDSFLGLSPEEQEATVDEIAASLSGPQTNVAEQAGSGINEGIANAVGLPVDLVTKVLNMGAAAMGLPQIEQPIGGSASLKGALDPFISDVEPQTGPQRFARRTGQEVGAAAVTGPAMGVRAAGATAANLASAVGSGLGASTAQEVAPGNEWAELGASLAGGMVPLAAARAMRPGPKAPSRAELSATRKASYDKVDADPTRLSTTETADLKQRISDAVTNAKMHPQRHPKAASMVDELWQMKEPTLTELDQWRQVVSRDVAGAADDAERRLGQIIKDTIDGYVDQIKPGTFSEETVGALQAGREATSRIKKSDALETAIEKGERRAASTGTGGNTVNAIRQNVRAILDDPRKARQFSAEERQAMEDVVRGTATTNTLRMVGGFAPTGGRLAMAGLVGQAALAGGTGNPLFALPAFIGEIAKRSGEMLTERQVQRLTEIVRNGGMLPAAERLTAAEFNVLKAVLAAQSASLGGDRPQ